MSVLTTVWTGGIMANYTMLTAIECLAARDRNGHTGELHYDKCVRCGIAVACTQENWDEYHALNEEGSTEAYCHDCALAEMKRMREEGLSVGVARIENNKMEKCSDDGMIDMFLRGVEERRRKGGGDDGLNWR